MLVTKLASAKMAWLRIWLSEAIHAWSGEDVE